MNNKCKLIQDDCLEVMKKIPDESVDLIITDPRTKLLLMVVLVIVAECLSKA